MKDPLAARLREIADGAGRDPVRLANGLLAVSEVFGTDLPEVAVFRDTVTNHLKSLLEDGAKATVGRVG